VPLVRVVLPLVEPLLELLELVPLWVQLLLGWVLRRLELP
jgi:hypothetical protein